MEEKIFVKLSELEQFKVVGVGRMYWVKWEQDQATNKWVSHKTDRYIDGYKMAWDITTDKGVFTASKDQVQQMLIGAYSVDDDKASLKGMIFKVKTNGETGKDIRYYINPSYDNVQEKVEIPF
jgi:hypothetical protein